jgi:hypothetical protein
MYHILSTSIQLDIYENILNTDKELKKPPAITKQKATLGKGIDWTKAVKY